MYVINLHDPHFLPHSGCDVSWSLEEGRGLILTGENGIGKTTLLNRVWELLNTNHDVSYVPQLSPEMFYDRRLKVFRRLFLSSTEQHIDEDLFRRMWRGFGLEDKEDRQLSSLSGGEQQGLKLSCFLSQKSSIVLLDEPSQYLDQEKRSFLKSILLALKSQRAILMVDHDLNWCGPDWEVVQVGLVEKTVKEVARWNI